MGVAAILLAATSCQKGEDFTTRSGGMIPWSFDASMGDLVQMGDVRAAIETVVQVRWQAGDSVHVYDEDGKIGWLIVTPKEDERTAHLDGSINPTDADSITLVYSNMFSESNPAPKTLTGKKLKIDMCDQSKEAIPFVLYATSGKEPKEVDFKFATAVMKISGTGLGEGSGIEHAIIKDVNDICELTINNSSSPTVKGDYSEESRIYRGKCGNNFAESSDGRVVFSIGLTVNGEKSGRSIIIKKGGDTYTASFTRNAIRAGAAYNSVNAFTKWVYDVK